MAETTFIPTSFSKLAQDFHIPGVDWQELLASQEKNIQALTQANQALMEGAQAVVQRQVELLQQTMSEVVDASQSLMKQGDPQANAAIRCELAKTSFETSIANMRELAELARKSNRDAFEMINARVVASFDELKAAIIRMRS